MGIPEGFCAFRMVLAFSANSCGGIGRATQTPRRGFGRQTRVL
jgi:hypothetical protein